MRSNTDVAETIYRLDRGTQIGLELEDGDGVGCVVFGGGQQGDRTTGTFRWLAQRPLNAGDVVIDVALRDGDPTRAEVAELDDELGDGVRPFEDVDVDDEEFRDVVDVEVMG
jgi:hypothetical protein